MADNRIVPSEGTWEGEVTVQGVTRKGEFEVFDSGGAWTALFGKPLLREFKAVHDYETDEIRLWKNETTVITIKNRSNTKDKMEVKPAVNITTITDDTVLTRETDPFKPGRINAIIDLITIGNDLSNQEKEQVKDLIREFADC